MIILGAFITLIELLRNTERARRFEWALVCRPYSGKTTGCRSQDPLLAPAGRQSHFTLGNRKLRTSIRAVFENRVLHRAGIPLITESGCQLGDRSSGRALGCDY